MFLDDKHQAKKIAKNFFCNNRPQLQVNELKMVFDGETPESRSTGANPALYVFDNPNGKGFVIVAGDASDNTKKMFTNMCRFYKVPLHIFGTKEDLGGAMGKEFRASLALIDPGFAKAIQEKLVNISNMEV